MLRWLVDFGFCGLWVDIIGRCWCSDLEGFSRVRVLFGSLAGWLPEV